MFPRNVISLLDTRVNHSPDAVFCVLEISWLVNIFQSVLWEHVSSLWKRLAGPPSWELRPSVTPSQLNLKGRVASLQQGFADTTQHVNSHSNATVALVPLNPPSHFSVLQVESFISREFRCNGLILREFRIR
jgi:hypothetical protein